MITAERARPFFWFARERQGIYLKRQSGDPWPWTSDHVLQKFRFTNVFRENDATTVWFREKVRDPMHNRPEVLLATVLFRWFNRTTTGEAIFRQIGDWQGRGKAKTAWEWYLETNDTDVLRSFIVSFCGKGPYVTGAYIIKTPDGLPKLDGVLWCVDQFRTQEKVFRDRGPEMTLGCQNLASLALSLNPDLSIEKGVPLSLESVWEWLRRFPFLGDFMAYEIVTDLRHTDLLSNAPDIMTWANPGPGAMRGLNRITGRDLNKRQQKYLFVTEMRALLELSKSDPSLWPNTSAYPSLEMRDIEHTLCEFDKYERARLGQGRPRGVYRHDQ